MRLFFKDACQQVKLGIEGLMLSLLLLAKRYAPLPIPTLFTTGTTGHRGSSSTCSSRSTSETMSVFSGWRAREYLSLGAGAIAGSTLSLIEELVYKMLGFVDEKGLPRITLTDAVSDRDLFVEFTSASSICSFLSRLAEDLIMEFFGIFICSVTGCFTTGSSLMPQKKPGCFPN